MKCNWFLVFVFSFTSHWAVAQPDSSSLQISVLTCGAGDQLYTIFGHSAIRVKDDSREIDEVYNYGTFDNFGAGFAINFMRGKLNYALSRYSMNNFIREYHSEQRSVKEQVLALTYTEKVALFKALEENVRKENRYYKYDFFHDNCVTRIRDITESIVGEITYHEPIDESFTYRDLLHSHLTFAPWTEFGMDIVLGQYTDTIAGVRGQMFLPSYYGEYLTGSSYEKGDFVATEMTMLEFPTTHPDAGIWTPNFIFGAVLVIELIVFFLFFISGDEDFMKWIDRLWFGALFIAFLIMGLLWVTTDHEVCRANYNLLWTVPWTVFAMFQKRDTKKIMFLLTILLTVFLLLFWSIIPQSMPLPVLLICLVTLLKSLRHIGMVRWINRLRRARTWTMIVLCLALFSNIQAQERITGITVVAPPNPFESDPMIEVEAVNAKWIALVPYGVSNLGQPEITWGSSYQWWGESPEGIEASVKLARKHDLQIMLKPQIWIPNGWVGDMDFDKEEDWLIWERSYKNYIWSFVDLAIQYDIEMICIGTEYRISAQKREPFWRQLISEVREKYKGKLTYSSNWDSYEDLPFWDVLDYVGISAYFPLTDMTTPMVMVLDYKWNKYVRKLEKFSGRTSKKILFTEYGYLTVDGAAGKTWELEKNVTSRSINEQAQSNGYEALLAEFSDEDFWAGGFLWKWFPEGQGHEGYPERDYSPQNKKAEKVLSTWYKKINELK